MDVGEGKADLDSYSSKSVLGTEAGHYPFESATTIAAGNQLPNPQCPNGCKDAKIYRDGLRYNGDQSTTQRWLCRCCGLRFSANPLKSQADIDSPHQIRARGAKNLHVFKHKHLGTRELTDEEKAVVKVFEGYLQNKGYRKQGVRGFKYASNVKSLLYLGADLNNPEDVKEKLGTHNINSGAKLQWVYSYEAYMAFRNSADKEHKLSWERPIYKQEEEIPFIPEEGELDQLIAAANSHQLSTYLQTMKETFADPGEALRIEWKDIAGNAITINHPVKNHRPRSIEVSSKLIAMLNMLPHKLGCDLVFSRTYNTLCVGYVNVRNRLAEKTKNDRLRHIEFRSFRHWGGTHIAELSNGNVITVMKFLGHKSVANSMKYINIWKLSFKTETEFEFLVVTTPDELKLALVGGYTFVIEKFGASWFRRPKRIAIAGIPIDNRLPSLCGKEKPAEVEI